MPTVKCPLCGEIMLDIEVMPSHMAKAHRLDFADKEDMNRRLQAIGFDPIKETEQKPQMRVLHG